MKPDENEKAPSTPEEMLQMEIYAGIPEEVGEENHQETIDYL